MGNGWFRRLFTSANSGSGRRVFKKRREDETEQTLLLFQKEVLGDVTSLGPEKQKVLNIAPGRIRGEVRKEGADLATKYETIVCQKPGGLNGGRASSEHRTFELRRKQEQGRDLCKNNSAPP